MFSRVLAICLGVLALSGCALLQPEIQTPRIELQSLLLERLALTDQVFRARLAVSNPNGFGLNVRGASVDLLLEGIEIGNGATISGIKVPANGREFVDVRFSTNLMASAPRLLTWLNSGDRELDYRLVGDVNLGLAGLARLRIDEAGKIDAAELY